MTIDMGKTLAFTAISGMVTGLAACAAPAVPDPAVPEGADPAGAMPAAAGAKDCCKGKNDCAGKGHCKTDANPCGGKNECKGKGGCQAPDCKDAAAH